MLTGEGQVQGTDSERETNAGWTQTVGAHKDLSLSPRSLVITFPGDLLSHRHSSWRLASGFLIPGPWTLPSKDGIQRTMKLAGGRSYIFISSTV